MTNIDGTDIVFGSKLTDAAVQSLNRHMTCSICGAMPDNTLKESKIHHFSKCMKKI